MTISTMDGLVAALPGRFGMYQKPSMTSEGAGTWQSLWLGAGTPAAGVAAVNAVPTKDTLGAIAIANAAVGNRLALGRLLNTGATAGILSIYDRLWHTSGLSGIVVAADTAVATTALTRETTGAGVQLWAEVYTAMGATAATLNVRYTNQDGVPNRVGTYAHPANALTVGQMVPINLQAGDTGVRAVTAYHWSISTGTAGSFGFTLVKRIADIPMEAANVAKLMDAFALGLPQMDNDACLALMVYCTTTSTGIIQGTFNLIEG